MDEQLYADMIRELAPAARRLKRDDEINAELGIERWPDDRQGATADVTYGLLRRLLAALSEAQR